MKKLLAVGLVSTLLVGCAGGPKASKEEDQIAKQFISPTNGTSNLYIYRNEYFGGGIDMDVYIDEQKVAITGPKTYIFQNLNAGEHKIESEAFEGKSILNIDMQPNKTHYIWQEVKMGVFGARNKLQEVSEEEGKKGVLESSLLLSSPHKITKKEMVQIDYNPAPVATVTKVSTKKQDRNKSQKQTQRQKNYYGSCPCGTGSACYGPRGGRYCYTSGGNKRYF